MRARVGEARVAVGPVTDRVDGLSRQACFLSVRLRPDPERESGRYVVLLPQAGVDAEYGARARREALLLAALTELAPELRIPKLVALFRERAQPILVETPVDGRPLDLRAGNQPGVRPPEVVAKVAAAVHAVDPRPLLGAVLGYPDCRQHARAELAWLEGLSDEPARQALAWARAHLPPADRPALLHGDLLGQNILLPKRGSGDPPGVVDWERAFLGDPGDELATVTRGALRPFGQDDGLARLIDAYAAAGGRRIPPSRVHFYELCAAARRVHHARSTRRGRRVGRHFLGRLRGILRRAEASI